MSKKELKLHSVVAPTQTVIVSAYDKDGKADACTLAFYMVSSHIPPCVTIGINATQKRKTLRDILETKAFVLGLSPGQVGGSKIAGPGLNLPVPALVRNTSVLVS